MEARKAFLCSRLADAGKCCIMDGAFVIPNIQVALMAWRWRLFETLREGRSVGVDGLDVNRLSVRLAGTM